jgi:hypothetical protein
MIAQINKAAVVAAIIVSAAACKGKTAGPAPEASSSPAVAAPRLVDLSASLEAARTAFNAHKKEARFLALLSPA